ncbi:hypothetical protein PybrP1_005078 [[Pythium] brassicae (nom. inval.)]|nr:hypothetical protein PybrP1_005078 [[Pythium] brassicae (nom. inval.)]
MRYKAAGLDGLAANFYKDCSDLMVPQLAGLCTQILAGVSMPRSFVDGLAYSLRRKGDSANAMDYRPISQLQAGYKAFTKLIAQAPGGTSGLDRRHRTTRLYHEPASGEGSSPDRGDSLSGLRRRRRIDRRRASSLTAKHHEGVRLPEQRLHAPGAEVVRL